VKRRILHHYQQGLRPPTIYKLLKQEKINTTRAGIAKFINKFERTGLIARTPGSGRPTKITEEMRAFVEERMREDDETTAIQLHALLKSKGYQISTKTILRCRTELGWTFRGSVYCQLIREPNKAKRLDWAQQYLNDNFDNVIWSDECSVQLETHKRFCCRKRGEPPKLKPRYKIYINIRTHVITIIFSIFRAKHPVKVHVWAGISRRGKTGVCIFEGTMDATLYIKILEKTLIPFVESVYPNSHRLMAAICTSDPSTLYIAYMFKSFGK